MSVEVSIEDPLVSEELNKNEEWNIECLILLFKINLFSMILVCLFLFMFIVVSFVISFSDERALSE